MTLQPANHGDQHRACKIIKASGERGAFLENNKNTIQQ